MRRKDREVTDINEITDILMRCKTIRIGIQGNEFPYVVPVSFGTTIHNGTVVIYFHCAKQGEKVDLLLKNPNICIEGDIFDKVEKTQSGITARYESVIGFGTCVLSEDSDEIRNGLEAILNHYGCSDYTLEQCGRSDNLYIGKITLKTITGKRNLSQASKTADAFA